MCRCMFIVFFICLFVKYFKIPQYEYHGNGINHHMFMIYLFNNIQELKAYYLKQINSLTSKQG